MNKNQSPLIFPLEIKTVSVLVILVLAGISVAFYLGKSYGMSSRNTEPGQVVIRTLEKDTQKDDDARSALFDPAEGDKTVESYEKMLHKILNEDDPKPTKPAAQNSPVTAAVDEKTPTVETSPAKNSAKPEPAKPYYTVQIVATGDYDKANGLIAALKKKKFEAYIENTPLNQGRTLYRVRVGRSSKAVAEAVKEKLQNEFQGLGELRVLEVE